MRKITRRESADGSTYWAYESKGVEAVYIDRKREKSTEGEALKILQSLIREELKEPK